MAYCNTILNQMVKIVSRHDFAQIVRCHRGDHRVRTLSCWTQFISLLFAQMTSRDSLRDLSQGLKAASRKLYHLGIGQVKRSTLSDANSKRPYEIYKELFYRILDRCQAVAPRSSFRFKNPLLSLDSTTIKLCLTLFPWAKFRSRKGAIKLHAVLSQDSELPTFVEVTDGKTADLKVAKSLSFAPGSILAIDRGFIDYSWLASLHRAGCYFVTRLKNNLPYNILERRAIDKSGGISSDQTIRLTSRKAEEELPIKLRRIRIVDPVTRKPCVLLTNCFHLCAKTICDIYKRRWQIELFFKWIKQNLKIKTFLGTSFNAVMTQIWVAMCSYLLLAFLKFTSKSALSLRGIKRLFEINIFEKLNLQDLLLLKLPIPEPYHLENQLVLNVKF